MATGQEVAARIKALKANKLVVMANMPEVKANKQAATTKPKAAKAHKTPVL